MDIQWPKIGLPEARKTLRFGVPSLEETINPSVWRVPLQTPRVMVRASLQCQDQRVFLQACISVSLAHLRTYPLFSGLIKPRKRPHPLSFKYLAPWKCQSVLSLHFFLLSVVLWFSFVKATKNGVPPVNKPLKRSEK